MRRGGGSGGIGGRWLFVLLCGWLMAAVCEGQGHFRFASMHWERSAADAGYIVTYTIRSSWQRDYPDFKVRVPSVIPLAKGIWTSPNGWAGVIPLGSSPESSVGVARKVRRLLSCAAQH